VVRWLATATALPLVMWSLWDVENRDVALGGTLAALGVDYDRNRLSGSRMVLGKLERSKPTEEWNGMSTARSKPLAHLQEPRGGVVWYAVMQCSANYGQS